MKRYDRKAKIMVTIGPASRSPAVLRALLDAGADIVRLNLSHGTHPEHRETVDRVRACAAELRRHVPIVLDLAGPRYRVGDLPEGGVVLEEGQRVVLRGDELSELPVGQPEIVARLDVGERVLIDGGRVELRVEERRPDAAVTSVVHGGVVTSRKGINLPDTKLPFEITAKDREDIAFAAAMRVDLIGASYVARPDDLGLLRAAIAGAGPRIPLVAKIERAAALEHVDAIVRVADAVMVARGDLGVEVPFEIVPLVQRRICAAGRATGTPVIVATDMLASMIDRPRPTRAEVSDVATAVFDGADALMLSGETAIGRYPVEAVRAMVRTVERAEAGTAVAPPLDAAAFDGRPHDVPEAVAAAAAHAAQLLDVRLIVVFTQTGSTARLMARHRPAIPIVALTNDAGVARRMQLLRGVEPAVVPTPRHHEDLVDVAERELLRRARVRPDDVVIVLMGAPVAARPRTNLMHVHRIRDVAPPD